MSFYIIDKNSARQRAENFLQQHYSVVKTQRVVLEDGIWSVDVLVSPSDRTINVQINSRTGSIVGYQ
jgi:hypothetical protein